MPEIDDLKKEIAELRGIIDSVSKGVELKAKAQGIHIGSLRVYEELAAAGDSRLYQEEKDGTITDLTGYGAGGAPSNATFLVTTANADLSAEVVVGATPGGELGGSWGTPTVDATHSGSLHLTTATDGAHTIAAGNIAAVDASTSQHGHITDAAQTLGGAKTFADGILTDTIGEETSAAGVTVDGVLLKDKYIQLSEVTVGDCDDQIDTELDDAFERQDTGAAYPSGVTVNIETGDAADIQWGGLRFNNGPFPPKGSTVTAAYFSVYLFEATWDDANFDIYAEDAAGPIAFTTTAFDITNRVPPRTLTTASIPWVANSIAAGGVGWFNSPELKTVIQELADGYDITSIVLILKPKVDLDKHFYFRSWDYDTHVLGAKLHLEWSAGPTGVANTATVYAKEDTDTVTKLYYKQSDDTEIGPLGTNATNVYAAGAMMRTQPYPPGIAGEDGEDGFPIPGPRGAAGISVMGPPGRDGEDGEDGFPIPGSGSSYSDAEAIAAIEAHAALGLAGSVAIAAGQTLTVDTINETTGTAGVTIDDTLIKDNHIYPDLGNLNASLLTSGNSLFLFGCEADNDYIEWIDVSNTWAFNIAGTSELNIKPGAVEVVTQLEVDTVTEQTGGAGVTIDGVLIKDGLVDGRDISAMGIDLIGPPGVDGEDGETLILMPSLKPPRYIALRALDAATSHTVLATVGGDFSCPLAGAILDVGAYVDTAGATSTATIDIHKNGTTIFSTKITIDSAEKTSRTAAAAPVLNPATNALAVGDILTVDIDVLQTTAAKGLTVWLSVREA